MNDCFFDCLPDLLLIGDVTGDRQCVSPNAFDFFGKLIEQKGVHVLIDALASLEAKLVDPIRREVELAGRRAVWLESTKNGNHAAFVRFDEASAANAFVGSHSPPVRRAASWRSASRASVNPPVVATSAS